MNMLKLGQLKGLDIRSSSHHGHDPIACAKLFLLNSSAVLESIFKNISFFFPFHSFYTVQYFLWKKLPF